MCYTSAVRHSPPLGDLSDAWYSGAAQVGSAILGGWVWWIYAAVRGILSDKQ